MVPQGSGWALEGSSTSRMEVMPIPPLTGGFPTNPAPQGVQFPFAGSSYSHLIPPGSNPVSHNVSVAH